jgi:hypothetical protein
MGREREAHKDGVRDGRTPAPAALIAPGPATADPKLDRLRFSKEQCEAALRMADGNEEYAASVLFDQMS